MFTYIHISRSGYFLSLSPPFYYSSPVGCIMRKSRMPIDTYPTPTEHFGTSTCISTSVSPR